MTQDRLALLCAAIALLGLAALSVLGKSPPLRDVAIESVNATPAGSPISIVGRVAGVYAKNGHGFLKLCNRACLDVFLPDGASGYPSVLPAKGAFVRASGTLQEYQGRLEITVARPSDLEVIRP